MRSVVQENACTRCASNCLLCMASYNGCVVCADGYVLLEGQCYQAIAGCLSAVLQQTEVVCQLCEDQYYKDGSACSRCVAASEKWVRCAGPFDEPAMSPLQPTQCAAGYYLLEGGSAKECVSNASNCLTVVDSSTC